MSGSGVALEDARELAKLELPITADVPLVKSYGRPNEPLDRD